MPADKEFTKEEKHLIIEERLSGHSFAYIAGISELLKKLVIISNSTIFLV